MIKITYGTDIGKQYHDGLVACKSHEELIAHLTEWKPLAADALTTAQAPGFDWAEYQKGLKSEKKRVFSGEAWIEKYGTILIPEIFLRAALVAAHFMTPDGTAFIRLEEEGYLKKNADGIYYWDGPEDGKVDG